MSAQCKPGIQLVQDVHEDLVAPGQDTEFVKGSYDYYYYGCDSVDDRGWGCGYRTLQTMSSWIQYQKNEKEKKVPTIAEIQDALVKMEDKPSHFRGFREWIGSFEISICLDYFYDVPCRLVHVASGGQLADHIDTLYNHFHILGSPIMMGGDSDNASKGIVGVCKNPPSLLIVDPHHYGSVKSKKDLQENKMVVWRHVDTFHKDSFYNFCLPQLKYTTK